MATKTRISLVGALVAGALALGIGQASAMPRLDHGLTTAVQAGQVEHVRWVCGPWRCFWRPNFFYRPYAFYRPRPYWYRPYAFFRPRPYWAFHRPRPFWGWHRWHRWG
jgi:hypothetical protein